MIGRQVVNNRGNILSSIVAMLLVLVLVIGSGGNVLATVVQDSNNEVFTSVAQLTSNTTYSALDEFSTTNGNPNGVWSYGWMPTDFSSYNLYTNKATDIWGDIWYGWGADRSPHIWLNNGDPTYGVPTGSLSLHPGNGRQPAVLRWTAPFAGEIEISGEFLPGDSGTMSVAVRCGSEFLWNATDSSSFDLITDIAGGGTIDFVVYGGYWCGNTPISATITFVGITVNPTSGLVTTEAGGTATFSVVLNTQPTANVSIGLSSSDLTEGTVSPASLSFTSANWNTPQTVTVTGVDDALADGNVAYTIVTAAASSTDTNYNGFNAADVSVTNSETVRPPVVTDDGDTITSTSQLHAVWSSTDAESDIAEYQYAIGTSSGGTEVVVWTSTGTSTDVTRSGLNLTWGATYYFAVKAKNGVGAWSEAGVSNGITLSDPTPASIPIVTDDGDTITSTSQLHATWSSSDTESGIVECQYAIGTSSGATDVVDWTSAGTNTSVTHTGLNLSAGTAYYIAVKAKNGTGAWSDVGVSNGIAVPDGGNGIPIWVWIIVGIAAVSVVGLGAYLVGKRRPAKP